FLILIVVYLLLLIILFKARKNSRIYYKHIIDLIIFIVLFFCGLFIHYSLASGVILIAFVYILIKVRKINSILKYFIDILLLLLILMIIVASIIKFHITSIIPEVLIINFLKYIVPIFFSFYLFFIGIDTIKHLISKHKDHTKNKLILYAFIMILVMLILPDFIFATIILDYYFSIYEFKNLLISNEESYKELFHYFLNNFMFMIENHYNISLHIEGMSECGECFKDNIGNTILFLHMLVNRMFELVVIGLIIVTIINKINQKT